MSGTILACLQRHQVALFSLRQQVGAMGGTGITASLAGAAFLGTFLVVTGMPTRRGLACIGTAQGYRADKNDA
jgi:hypothetical protein